MSASFVAGSYGTGLVLGHAGVAHTHGLTIVDGDLILLINGAGTSNVGSGGETITAFACSGFSVTSPSTFDQQGGGNDRVSEVLWKVASSEGSSYTITRTGDTVSRNQSDACIQIRGQDTSSPFDVAPVITQGTNSANPNAPDITTVTDDCLLVTYLLISYGDTESQSGDALVAPSGWTMVGSPTPFDGNSTTSPRGIALAVAYKTAGAAGVQSGAAWQNTGLDGTQEYQVGTLAIRPAPAPVTGNRPTPTPSGRWSTGRRFRVSRATAPAPNPPGEVTPGPVISNVVVSSITETSAIVSWDLDQVGTGIVDYGTTTSYGSSTTPETGYDYNHHSQTISGLSAGVTYHFQVRSSAPESAPVESTSSDYSFATPGGDESYTEYTYPGTGSIQSFLDSVPSGTIDNHSRVIFPTDGDYSITSRLTINGKSWIDIYGCDPSVVAANGAYSGATARCKITNTDDGTAGLATSVFSIANDSACHHIGIYGFELVGAHSAAGTSGAYVSGREYGMGVNVYAKSGTDYIRIAYNHMRNLYGHGVYVRCNGGETAPNEVDIDHNRIRLTGVMGVAVATGTNVRIDDNLIEDIGLYPVDFEDGVTGQVLTNIYVRRNAITRWTWNNAISSPNYQGRWAITNDSSLGTVQSGFTIQDNVLSGGRQNGTGSPYGQLIDLRGTDSRSSFLIDGNTCDISFDGAQMRFDSVAGITITDNVFTPAGGGSTDTIAQLVSCTGTSVSGNTPSGTS